MSDKQIKENVNESIKCAPLSHSYSEFTQTRMIYGIEHYAIFCTKCGDIKYFQQISEEQRERLEGLLTKKCTQSG